MSCDPGRTIDKHPSLPQAAYTALRPAFSPSSLPTDRLSSKAPADVRIATILGLRGSRLPGVAGRLVDRLAEAANEGGQNAKQEIDAIRTVLPTLRCTDEVVQALRKIVRDQNPWVRDEVARAIGDLMDDALVLDAARMLNDREPSVRQSAQEALWRYGLRALPVMNHILRSPKAPEAAAIGAVKVVLQMIGEDCVQPDRTDQAEQFREITDTLLDVMDDPRPNLRAAAIAGLASMFKSLPSRVQARIVFCSVNDEDPGVRRLANEILDQNGTYVGSLG